NLAIQTLSSRPISDKRTDDHAINRTAPLDKHRASRGRRWVGHSLPQPCQCPTTRTSTKDAENRIQAASLRLAERALVQRISAGPFLSRSHAPIRAPCNTPRLGRTTRYE